MNEWTNEWMDFDDTSPGSRWAMPITLPCKSRHLIVRRVWKFEICFNKSEKLTEDQKLMKAQKCFRIIGIWFLIRSQQFTITDHKTRVFGKISSR